MTTRPSEERTRFGGLQAGDRPGISGPLLDSVERWTRISLGLVSFAAEQSDSHLARAVGDPGAEGETTRTATPLPILIPGALFGLALEGQRRIFDLVSAAEMRLAVLVGFAGSRGPGSWAVSRISEALEPWEARWLQEQRTNRDAAADFLASIGPGTLDELLGRIDIERVVDRVPVEYVVDQIDINGIVAEVVHELKYTDLVKESTNAILKESTGALASTTADVVRGQVSAVSRFTSLPFRRRRPEAGDPGIVGQPVGEPTPPATPATGAQVSDETEHEPKSKREPEAQETAEVPAESTTTEAAVLPGLSEHTSEPAPQPHAPAGLPASRRRSSQPPAESALDDPADTPVADVVALPERAAGESTALASGGQPTDPTSSPTPSLESVPAKAGEPVRSTGPVIHAATADLPEATLRHGTAT